MKTPFQVASFALVPLLSLAACDAKRDPVPAVETTPAAPVSKPTVPPPAPAPDNTAKNKADAPGAPTETKTPMDQSESAAHIKMTADIRTAVLAIDGMSVNGKNCKIITDANGKVTLRGVVNSQSEKDKIDAKARSFAGVTNVDNQLEIKPG